MPSTNISNCPVGLLSEFELIDRLPERRAEIITHAIQTRERERVSVHEVRGLMGWHPIHTTKVVLLSGLVTFVLAWILSEFVAVSHWYVSARATSVTIPVPVIGNQVVNIGGYIPTSTALTTGSVFPVFGVRESLLVALAVMVVILLERVVMAVWHRVDMHKLSLRLTDLKHEITTLEEWKHHG